MAASHHASKQKRTSFRVTAFPLLLSGISWSFLKPAATFWRLQKGPGLEPRALARTPGPASQSVGSCAGLLQHDGHRQQRRQARVLLAQRAEALREAEPLADQDEPSEQAPKPHARSRGWCVLRVLALDFTRKPRTNVCCCSFLFFSFFSCFFHFVFFLLFFVGGGTLSKTHPYYWCC